MSRKAPVSEAPSEIDITEILERIPHRIPFLLVDRCEDYVASQSIVGRVRQQVEPASIETHMGRAFKATREKAGHVCPA